MSKKKYFWLIPCLAFVEVVVIVALALFTPYVRADDASCPPGQTLTCSMEGNTVVCKCEGGNSGTATPDNGGETPAPGGTPSCYETHYKSFGPAGPGRCYGVIENWDVCTNPNKLLEWHFGFFPCGGGTPTPPPPPSPCKDLSFDPNSGTINCKWNFQWELQAGVSMPPIVIDARPYPVTLVKWPTAMRVNALTNASGSGTLAYAGWGGGTPSSPAVGDWRDITLTLTFRPSGSPVSVTLMKQASLTAPSSGGPIKTFTWEVPSHPAVGATKTAGAVGQLGEIPSDIPLFEGHARTTYRLFYNLSYEERATHYVCYATPVPNALGTPSPGCANGEWVYSWDGKSKSGEILPSQVANLPPAMNGGSVFNDFSVVIRRMDDNGSTSNPKFAHSYSWGSIFYWACREGQGQIGWPNP
jgi:hypothetical protein